jgi:hypothetical protein
VHTFSSSVPILKAIARKFIMNYVRRDKDRNFSLKSKRFAAVTARGFVPFDVKSTKTIRMSFSAGVFSVPR